MDGWPDGRLGGACALDQAFSSLFVMFSLSPSHFPSFLRPLLLLRGAGLLSHFVEYRVLKATAATLVDNTLPD